MKCEVINGDSLVEMPKLRERGVIVDAVITSPPYNLGDERGRYPINGRWRTGAEQIGNGYSGFDDAMPHAEYVKWQKAALRACWDLLSPDGAIFYNHKPRVVKGSLRLPIDLVPEELRRHVRQEIIWARGSMMNFSSSFYCPAHERVIVIAKPDFRLKDRAASGVGDVWRIAPELNTPHPAPFPLELPRRILMTTNIKSVLDPFAGRFTTGVACVIEGRDFIGIEQSADYCAIGEAWMKRAQGIPADIPKLSRRVIETPLFESSLSAAPAAPLGRLTR